uniref:N-terminal EF-hand calcium binding protein 3 n=1 Tax=Salarias fasciatus TaxID=181472 RepID=A0A672HBN1_SALFA
MNILDFTESNPHVRGNLLQISSAQCRLLLCVSDDGKLSFDEFNTYFADGILTTEELQELFYSIDGLNAEEVYYFSQHLGEYLNVLSALEHLNIAILKAMDKTKAEYQDASVLGQFVTRFMLRETSSQLLSLQRSLQCAMEAVEEQSSPAPSVLQHDPACLVLCFLSDGSLSPPGVSMEDGENWCSQINRLQQLLDKLECQKHLLPQRLVVISLHLRLPSCCPQNILLVQRQMSVTDDDLDDFRKVLKSYIDATSAHSDNLHVSVQKLPGKSCYIMYEFWQDPVSCVALCSYLQSNSSKDFQRCVIDMLEDAETVSTMLLPGLYLFIQTFIELMTLFHKQIHIKC